MAGLLGAAAPVTEKGRTAAVADSPIGMGGTTQWKLAGLDARTTLCAFFEVELLHPLHQCKSHALTRLEFVHSCVTASRVLSTVLGQGRTNSCAAPCYGDLMPSLLL